LKCLCSCIHRMGLQAPALASLQRNSGLCSSPTGGLEISCARIPPQQSFQSQLEKLCRACDHTEHKTCGCSCHKTCDKACRRMPTAIAAEPAPQLPATKFQGHKTTFLCFHENTRTSCYKDTHNKPTAAPPGRGPHTGSHSQPSTPQLPLFCLGPGARSGDVSSHGSPSHPIHWDPHCPCKIIDYCLVHQVPAPGWGPHSWQIPDQCPVPWVPV